MRSGRTEEIEESTRKLVCLLSQIGKKKHIAFKMNEKTVNAPYSLDKVVQWAFGQGRRAPERFENLGIDIDKLDNLGYPFVEAMVEWERHLKYSKQMLWGKENIMLKDIDPSAVKTMTDKVRRRLLFVLQSDYSLFPGIYERKELAILFKKEQTLFANELDKLLPISTRRKFIKSLEGRDPYAQYGSIDQITSQTSTQLVYDDTIRRELITKVQDFVGRVLNYF